MSTQQQIIALDKQYKKLMEEAHKLMSRDRKASDAKIYEANMILEEIKKLERA